MIILARSWGRGVVVNMRPCQGRDRGFEPRRSRRAQFSPKVPVFDEQVLSETGIFISRLWEKIAENNKQPWARNIIQYRIAHRSSNITE